MSNIDSTPKPQIGTVAPVEVVSIWKHPMVLITAGIAILSGAIPLLVQLKQLPDLPTNVVAWLGTAIAILTAILTFLRNLGFLGLPQITPTAAARIIQTTPTEGDK